MFSRASIVLVSILGFGCDDEPVLQAIETPTLLDEIPSAEERIATKDIVEYQKKDGVYVDVRYLGGRRLDRCTTDIGRAIGEPARQPQGVPMRQGIRYQYDKGSVYICEDQVYRIDLALPEELRRSQVLQILGFQNKWTDLITHREYVLENEWGFVRFA